MRILTVISGIALMCTGIWCFAHRGIVFLNIAFVLGIVMVIVGGLSVLVYFFAPVKQEGFGWYLAEGLIAIILGNVVLANLLVADLMVPIFFGMWILFSGVMRATEALNLFLAKDNTWIFNVSAGTISIFCGIYAFFNQSMADPIPLIILIGIIFMMKGVNILGYGVFMPVKKKVSESRRHDRKQVVKTDG